MPRIEGIDKIFSIRPRQKFGRAHSYGRGIYGRSRFGDSDIYISKALYGDCFFGDVKYGELIVLSGIYHRNAAAGPNIWDRIHYYIPKNPREPDQQANRQKFADGVAGWQGLTPEQREVYNERAKGKDFFGYHLYLREYMSS